MKDRWYKFLFQTIDASVVSIFRIIFGCFMLYQIFYYFNLDYTYQFMSGPQVLFSYYGFSFIKPLPLIILKSIHVGLLLSAILITIGFWYRYAMILFFLGFTYFSFIDKTLFNNHIYLISLFSFVMIFVEADRKYSLHSRLANVKLPDQIPAWNKYLLIFLISLPYFFGGISKLSPNWLHTDLVKIIVSESKGAFLNGLFSEKLVVYLITYGGILYDLGIVFLLLFKRTRILGVVLVVVFNYSNNTILFNDIGIFPLLMIFSTLLFFDTEKVGKFINHLVAKKTVTKKEKIELRRLKKKKTQNLSLSSSKVKDALKVDQVWNRKKKITALCLGLFVIFHILFPFRYILFTTNPEWTGLGSRFAWRMKMQTREIINFKMTLIDRNTKASGDIDVTSFLSTNQLQHIAEDPYNLIHLANYLHPLVEKEYGIDDPIINVDLKVSFNGLPSQYMISPTVDLTRLDESPFANNSWIIPLNKNRSLGE